MNLQIGSFNGFGTTPDGQYGAVSFKTPKGQEVILEMTLPAVDEFISQLTSVGLQAAERQGHPGHMTSGEERVLPVQATHADASIGVENTTIVVLRFGLVTACARLPNDVARQLGEDLLRASTAAPPGTATQ